jgi:ABC-type amino acid transport system permease subunit
LPAPDQHVSGRSSERLALLVGLPILSTALFYALPPHLQEHVVIVFLPQILSYVGLIFWAAANGRVAERLGLTLRQLGSGLRWGIPTGLLLGLLNVSVILWVVPWLGGDISFLRETPHARMPTMLMLPWAIMLIAVLVELNFRGFLLGRLLVLWRNSSLGGYDTMGAAVSIIVASLVFSFDPFMVATFRHLHWIAIWDGMVWGIMMVSLRNLYAPMAAHAVEVIILYVTLKAVLHA